MDWWYSILGGCFFPIVYIFTRFVLAAVFPGSLTIADQYFVAEKCVSSLQALMATAAGLMISASCQENIMTDTYWLTNVYAWFALPYFLYDIWAIYNTHFYLNEEFMSNAEWRKTFVHFVSNNLVMLLHHTVLPLVLFPSVVLYRNNKGDFFVGVLYTCEAAIPFISLRFILAQLKLKHTAAYIISGLLMIVTFFFARIFLFPVLYWHYSRFSGIPFLQVPFAIPVKCNLGCGVILVVQFYFLFLMVRGAVRVFYKMYRVRAGKQAQE